VEKKGDKEILRRKGTKTGKKIKKENCYSKLG
jgi:hypothetical protein